jgi:hypothetical protein
MRRLYRQSTLFQWCEDCPIPLCAIDNGPVVVQKSSAYPLTLTHLIPLRSTMCIVCDSKSAFCLTAIYKAPHLTSNHEPDLSHIKPSFFDNWVPRDQHNS